MYAIFRRESIVTYKSNLENNSIGTISHIAIVATASLKGQVGIVDNQLKASAIIESTASNTRHALGDSDGGEAAAIIESIVSNTRHTLGNCQFCHKFAIQI